MMNEKIYYLIVNEEKMIENVIESEIEESDVKNILTDMFNNQLVVIIKDKEDLPKYKNSYYVNGKIYDPKPYPSWIIKDEQWQPPKNIPQDDKFYIWNEEKIDWECLDENSIGMEDFAWQ